jgi:hypothetical protein
MSRIEEAILKRYSGRRIAMASLMLGIAGFLPLQIYTWFGPADGNPIGLGLLAWATFPFAAGGFLVGAIKMLVEHFRGERR